MPLSNRGFSVIIRNSARFGKRKTACLDAQSEKITPFFPLPAPPQTIEQAVK
jgi:hypothetical protein